MPTPRRNFGTAASDGKIYAIGGGNNDFEVLSTVEEYDPASNTWTTRVPMSTAHHVLGVAALAGRIYAIGGWDGNVLNTVEEFTPASTNYILFKN